MFRFWLPPLCAFALLFLSSVCRADFAAYEGRPTITSRSERFTVVHRHDWTEATRPQRTAIFFDFARHDDIFSPAKNTFSFLKVFRRSDGKLLFRAPVPALTHLFVSPDERYIVGLSQIKLHNHYQVVVFGADGKRVYWEHISSSVARLSVEEAEKYFRRYPQARRVLLPHTKNVGGSVVIDYMILGVINEIGKEAWRALRPYRARNPYSPNFGESVTNWVTWFDRDDPQIQIAEATGQITLSLRDPKGERFSLAFPASSDK